MPPVEGERHTLQTRKPGGFNQWLPTNSKPAAELRIGAVKATVWENGIGGITRHNITFSRLYKDSDQWKTTQTCGRNDLLVLTKVADQTHSRIFEIQQGGDAQDEYLSPGIGGPWARVAALFQYQTGPNLDVYTIEVPAADQPRTGLLVGVASLKTPPTHCSIPNRYTNPLRTDITNCDPRHPRQPTASTVRKNQFTSAMPRPCQGTGYAPRRRVRQAIRESENPSAKFQKLSVAVGCF